MKITGESIKESKKRGEWAELRFMARAAEHGLSVSKPWGESCRYDFIVEHAGKFLRVQVKSTVCRKRHSYAYHVNDRSYTRDEIDFFAIYIIPKNLWFIFPAEIILKCTRNVILSPHMKVSKHGAYIEAWHLLLGKGHDPPKPSEPRPKLRKNGLSFERAGLQPRRDSKQKFFRRACEGAPFQLNRKINICQQPGPDF